MDNEKDKKNRVAKILEERSNKDRKNKINLGRTIGNEIKPASQHKTNSKYSPKDEISAKEINSSKLHSEKANAERASKDPIIQELKKKMAEKAKEKKGHNEAREKSTLTPETTKEKPQVSSQRNIDQSGEVKPSRTALLISKFKQVMALKTLKNEQTKQETNKEPQKGIIKSVVAQIKEKFQSKKTDPPASKKQSSPSVTKSKPTISKKSPGKGR